MSQKFLIDELRIRQDWKSLSAQIKKLLKKEQNQKPQPQEEGEVEYLRTTLLETNLELILQNHYATIKPDTQRQIQALENNSWDTPIPFCWKSLQSSSASIIGNTELKEMGLFVPSDMMIPIHKVSRYEHFLILFHIFCSLLKISSAQNMAIISRLLFSFGKYDDCYEILDRIHLKDADPVEFLKLSGYEKVLGVQVLCLKIITTAPRKCFVDKVATDLLQMVLIEHKLIADMIEEHSWWHIWIEEATYRAFFARIQEMRPMDAIQMARCYLEYTSLLPLSFEPLKKISLIRAYIHLLIQNFRPSTYKPPVQILSKDYDFEIETFHDEINILLSLYENLVSSFISFPRAGQRPRVSERMFDEITFLYSIFAPFEDPGKAYMYTGNDDKYQVRVETRPNNQPPIVTASQAVNAEEEPQKTPYSFLLDSMYRATKLTFRSKTILKRIGMIAYCQQSIDEANLAFKTYLEDRKESSIEWWQQCPVYPVKEDIYLDRESAFDVIIVNVVLSKLCFDANYSHLSGIFLKKADFISKRFPNECFALNTLILYHQSIYHWKQERRDQALNCMHEVLQLDPRNWGAYYCLALQQAELGNIKLANEHIRSAIKLNPSHVDCWHMAVLLALVSNDCETQYTAAEKAYRICAMAEKAIQSGRKAKLSKSRKMTRVGHHYSDEWINFMLTRVLLEETIRHYNIHNNIPIELDHKLQPIVEENNDILESYRNIFEAYIRTFFPKTGHMEQAYSKRPENSKPMFSATEQEFCNILPLPHVLIDLKSHKHPQISSFYPTSPNAFDSIAFTFTKHASINTSNFYDPVKYSWFMKKRKHRYMEIWTQVAQVFRRAGKYHDARVACLEAQKVERGNADVEFELGLIALFQPGKTEAHVDILDRIMDDSTENIPSNLFLVEDYDEPFPDVFSSDKLPLSPIISSSITPDAPVLSSVKNNIEIAMMHFKASLTYDDEHLYARTWLGRCYYLMGNYEQARAQLVKALQDGQIKGAKIWNTYHQLGLVYLKLGMVSKATESFSKAVSNEAASVPLMSFRGFEIFPKYH